VSNSKSLLMHISRHLKKGENSSANTLYTFNIPI